MGIGYMQLIDWRSIENLNMATPEFKQHILETAASLGKIVKIGDDLYAMADKLDDQDSWFTSLSMSSSLKDKWFDKEVITEVLHTYFLVCSIFLPICFIFSLQPLTRTNV